MVDSAHPSRAPSTPASSDRPQPSGMRMRRVLRSVRAARGRCSSDEVGGGVALWWVGEVLPYLSHTQWVLYRAFDE